MAKRKRKSIQIRNNKKRVLKNTDYVTLILGIGLLLFFGIMIFGNRNNAPTVFADKDGEKKGNGGWNNNPTLTLTPSPTIQIPTITLTPAATPIPTATNAPSPSQTMFVPTGADIAPSTTTTPAPTAAPVYNMNSNMPTEAPRITEPTQNNKPIPYAPQAVPQKIEPTPTSVTQIKQVTNSIFNSIKTQFQQWGIGVARPAPTPKIEETPQTPETMSEKVRLIYGSEGGIMTLSALTESGKTVNISAEEKEKMASVILSGLQSEGVDLTLAENGQFILSKGGVSASSVFPISADLDTKQLYLVDVEAQKKISVYPDRLTTILSNIDPEFHPNTNGSSVRLELRNGEVVYAVDGTRNYKVFGVLDSSAASTDFISADTGELVSQQQSVVGSVVRLFSI